MKDTVKAIIAGHWASFKSAISLIELWQETAKAMGEGMFEDSLLKVLNHLLSNAEIEEITPNYFQPKQGDAMNEQKPLTEEELRELKANSCPDDSVHVPQYEGTTAVEAAKIVEILEKRTGRLDEKEAEQLQTMQDIADKGGLTVDDVKSGNGPFRNDQDMLKGDSK